jgi:hypothetical protein
LEAGHLKDEQAFNRCTLAKKTYMRILVSSMLVVLSTHSVIHPRIRWRRFSVRLRAGREFGGKQAVP